MGNPPRPRYRAPALGIGLLFAIAAFVRLYRLDFGLPEVVWVDAFKYVDHAGSMVRAGSLRPHDFQHPGLYVNFLALLYGLFGVDSPYGRHLTGRLISALFGLGVVGAAWTAAGKIGDARAGVTAAAMTAVSIVCVTYSRVCAADGMLICFMTLALAALADLPRRPARYAAAGALIGLAAGAKYTGGLLAPFLALTVMYSAYVHKDRRLLWGGLAAGAAACIACFLLTSPWFLPLIKNYFQRLALETLLQSSGSIGRIHAGRFDYLFSSTPAWETPWLGTSLLANLGPLVLAAGAAAVVLGLCGRGGFGPVLYGLFIAVYLLMAAKPGHVKSPRYLLPALPVLFALIGWAAERFVVKRAPPFKRTLVWSGVLAALLAVPVAKTAAYVARLRRPSTNDMARAWVAANIPPNRTVFLGPFYTDGLTRLPLNFVRMRGVGGRKYNLPEGRGPSPERDPIFHAGLVDELARGGVRYLILNSYYNGIFSPVPENLRYFPRSTAEFRSFMERLRVSADLVHAIRGDAEGRFGPDIAVYRFKE